MNEPEDLDSRLTEVLADLAWDIDTEASQRKTTRHLPSIKIADMYVKELNEALTQLKAAFAEDLEKEAKNYDLFVQECVQAIIRTKLGEKP